MDVILGIYIGDRLVIVTCWVEDNPEHTILELIVDDRFEHVIVEFSCN
jgi:hypothetical protein